MKPYLSLNLKFKMNCFSTFVKYNFVNIFFKTLRIFLNYSSVTRFPSSVCVFTTVNSNSTKVSKHSICNFRRHSSLPKPLAYDSIWIINHSFEVSQQCFPLKLHSFLRHPLALFIASLPSKSVFSLR